MKRVTNLFVALMAVVVMVSCADKKSTKALGGEWDVVSVGELVVPDSVDAFMGFLLAYCCHVLRWVLLLVGSAANAENSLNRN